MLINDLISFWFSFFLDGKDTGRLQLETPDDVDISIEFKDWLFALEGAQEEAERWWFCDHEDSVREERCWHTTFQNICVKASSSKHVTNDSGKSPGKKRYPLELITVSTLFLLCNIFALVEMINLIHVRKYFISCIWGFSDCNFKTRSRQETLQ